MGASAYRYKKYGQGHFPGDGHNHGGEEFNTELASVMANTALRPRPPTEFPMGTIDPALARRQETLGRMTEALAAKTKINGVEPVGPLTTRSNAAVNSGANTPGGQAGARPTGQNGRLADNQLVSVGGGHRLAAKAAGSWNRMVADARAQGVSITLTDSYRTYASQVDVAKRKGLYSQGGLAATPGKSNHGWGTAVDVKTGKEWLAKNASRYGWKTIPREPWHWELA